MGKSYKKAFLDCQTAHQFAQSAPPLMKPLLYLSMGTCRYQSQPQSVYVLTDSCNETPNAMGEIKLQYQNILVPV